MTTRGATLLLALLAGGGWPALASAHGGGDAGSVGSVVSSWSFSPTALLLIAMLAGGYAWLWRRAHRGGSRFRLSRWRAAAFSAGVAALVVALLSPVDAYADDLFWVHMVQHVLLMSVAAPLLLLGAPVTVLLRGASPGVRQAWLGPLLRSRVATFATRAPTALFLFTATVWLWHLPALYDAAARSESLHVLEHVSFLGVSLLFWWLIIDADKSSLRQGHLVRASMLFAAIVQGLLLGVVLLVIDEPIYETYQAAAAARDWGPTALADQRTGAGLVWIPAGLAFAIALLVNFQAWLEAMEQRARREDVLRLRALRGEHGPGRGPIP